MAQAKTDPVNKRVAGQHAAGKAVVTDTAVAGRKKRKAVDHTEAKAGSANGKELRKQQPEVVPATSPSEYHPGPQFEEVRAQDGWLAGAAESVDTELWLLQLPHYWDCSITTTLRLQADAAGAPCGTCIDDEGTAYAVITESCSQGRQLHLAPVPDGLEPKDARPLSIARRVTLVRSEAALQGVLAAGRPGGAGEEDLLAEDLQPSSAAALTSEGGDGAAEAKQEKKAKRKKKKDGRDGAAGGETGPAQKKKKGKRESTVGRSS